MAEIVIFFYIVIGQRDIMSPDYVYILYCTNMSREDWNITNSLETFHILTYQANIYHTRVLSIRTGNIYQHPLFI